MKKENRQPNFLIVGVAKAGTTSLYEYLRKHEDIYMPDIVKEPGFFSTETLKKVHGFHKFNTFKTYLTLFKNVKDEKLIGEASVAYFNYHLESIPKIKNHLGDIKIIIILRDPVDRCISSYQYALRSGKENRTFQEVIEADFNSINAYDFSKTKFHYVLEGMYYDKLKAFKDNFSNVKIIFQKDLKHDTKKTVSEVFNFLGINKNQTVLLNNEYNKGGWVPENQKMYNWLFQDNFIVKTLRINLNRQSLFYSFAKKIKLFLITNLIKKKTIKYSDFKEEEKVLRKYYRNDIIKTEKLLDITLKEWYIKEN